MMQETVTAGTSKIILTSRGKTDECFFIIGIDKM